MTVPSAPRRRDDIRMRTAEIATLTDADLQRLPLTPAPSLPIPATVALVAVGGAFGALARFLMWVLIPSSSVPTLVSFPWSTLLVNMLGCILLGFLNGYLDAFPTAPRWWRPLLGVGFAGGFTTFSGVILEGASMIGGNEPVMALAYAIFTVLGAMMAIVLGFAMGSGLGSRRARRATLAGGVHSRVRRVTSRAWHRKASASSRSMLSPSEVQDGEEE